MMLIFRNHFVKKGFLVSLFFISLSDARLIDFEVINRGHEVFDLKEICKKSGQKHNLLVRAEDTSHVNCMGKRISILDFCRDQSQKQPFRRPFLRGYIATNEQEELGSRGFCITGDFVNLRFSCETESFRELCGDTEKGCNSLRRLYAYDLLNIYHTRVFEESDEHLICRFGPQDQDVKISPLNDDNSPHILPMIPDN